MKKICFFFFVLICCFLSAGAVDLKQCRIVVSEDDAALVKKMGVVLSEDIERVTGVKPVVETSGTASSKNEVVLATVEHLPASLGVDVSDVRGCWERYKIVMIGKKIWMAENLRFDAPGSECLERSLESCEQNGRYYTWAQAVGAAPNCNQNVCKLNYEKNFRGICPEGWHVPSNADWVHLTTYVNVRSKGRGAQVLKSTYGWRFGNGTNESNFNALPSGFRFANGNFLDLGVKARFWSVSQINEMQATSWELSHRGNGLVQIDDYKSNELPLRCIKND